MPAQLQLFESRDISAPWNVRISRRARRLSVRVYPGGRVEVVVPPGASPTTVHKFVHTHREWIDRRVSDLSSAQQVADSKPVSIELRAIGKTYSLTYVPSASKTVSIRGARGETALHVSGAVESDRAVASALRAWLSTLARDELGRSLSAVANASDFHFERIQVRRQRTRWGSCSASGTISLNVCLLFLDPAVVRYLLVHELCHTRHMNHSKRFWDLVEAYEPDYKRLDRELLRAWQAVPGWVFG